MSWASLALAVVQLAISVLEWSKRREIFAAAQEQESARQALRLLELTEQGRRLRAELAKLTEGEALALWEDMVK
jgi:hypothetical protein